MRHFEYYFLLTCLSCTRETAHTHYDAAAVLTDWKCRDCGTCVEPAIKAIGLPVLAPVPVRPRVTVMPDAWTIAASEAARVAVMRTMVA